MPRLSLAPGMLAARRPGAPGLLAQVAPLGEGEEGHDVRARERDHAGVGDAALARRLPGRGANEVRQAGEVGLAAQHQLVARLVGEHVLAEARGQVGQPLHHLGIALLRRAVEARAGAHEVGVVALEHAQLLVAEAELLAPAVQRVDPGEQGAGACRRGCRAPPAAAPCRARPPAAPARSRSRSGCRRGRRSGRIRRPARSSAADGVLEGRAARRDSPIAPISARWSRIATSNAGAKCSARTLGERRQAVLAGPGLQQGVLGHGLVRHFLRLMSFRSRSS